MNRRSPRSAQRDDYAFPIRIKLAVPRLGLGKRQDDMNAWLRDNLPGDTYAVHSAPRIGGDAIAIYFTSLDDAAAFLEAFPDMSLIVPPGR